MYLGLFDAAQGRGPAAWAAMPAAVMLAMTGALALATFVKAGAMTFLGAPRTRAAAQAHESGRWMRAPMLVLAGGCLALGLAPVYCWPAIARGVGAWRPVWSGTELPAPMGLLGATHLALAVGALAAAAGLWRLAHAAGLRRAPTWDCGYAAPSPRMQYTSGSFAGIATGWFAPLFRVERRLRRPRGPWPGRASLVERVPETVLDRLLEPAGAAVLRFSSQVRRLQHGRLQYYIVYVVAGVAAVGALVWLEGAR